MPDITETYFARSASAWHKWLIRHHAKKDEIWLIFLKKHVDRPCVTYDEAVEEALCHGWIDGLLKRIDDEKFTIRFTPRKPKSRWSEINKRRVLKLTRAGRMTEVGKQRVADAKKSGAWQNAYGRGKPVSMPADLRRALRRNRRAKENFSKMTVNQQRNYMAWVLDAKHEETRAKRIRDVVRRAAQNKKPGLV